MTQPGISDLMTVAKFWCWMRMVILLTSPHRNFSVMSTRAEGHDFMRPLVLAALVQGLITTQHQKARKPSSGLNGQRCQAKSPQPSSRLAARLLIESFLNQWLRH